MRAWGGARAGAGRPPSKPLSSQPHKKRRPLERGESVAIVARVVRGVGDLHRPAAVAAIERAVALSRERPDFQITSLAVLPGPSTRTTRARRSSTALRRLTARLAPRLELAVEATDHVALARGMQGFQVSLARALNRISRRRGTVFVDRYAIRPRK